MIGYGQGRTETSMNRASSVIFVSLLVVFSFLTLNSIGDLPEKIAIHFDANGTADVWTSRETYRGFALLPLVGLPLLLVWIMAGASLKVAAKSPTANIGLLVIGSS